MPKVDVFDLTSAKVGEIDLADDVFGVEINHALLYEAVREYNASRRAGTHKTKTRHEVAGSGKKLWKQKGTGRARSGSIRSPLWRHGGTSHGPQPRDYSYSLPKKMLLGALRSALTAKLRDGELAVISSFTMSDHKTKTMRATLSKMEANKKVLIVDNEDNRNLALGARNLPGVTLLMSREVSVYHLLGAQKVFLTQAVAERFSQTLGPKKEAA